MASKLRIAGLGLLIIGVLLFTVLNFIGIVFLPLGGKIDLQSNDRALGNTEEDLILIGNIWSDPAFLSVKVTFQYNADSAYECTFSVIIINDDYPQGAAVPGANTYYSESSGTDGNQQVSLSGIISSSNLRSSTGIYLRIDNDGSSTVNVPIRQLIVVSGFLGIITPGLIALIGLVVTVISFIKGREPTVKQPAAATEGGWEPTLQWGSGAQGTAKKKPKMAVSSTKGKPVQKKAVKKVSKAGASVTCKFCGKGVSSTAFFCPSCYGKLR